MLTNYIFTASIDNHQRRMNNVNSFLQEIVDSVESDGPNIISTL